MITIIFYLISPIFTLMLISDLHIAESRSIYEAVVIFEDGEEIKLSEWEFVYSWSYAGAKSKSGKEIYLQKLSKKEELLL